MTSIKSLLLLVVVCSSLVVITGCTSTGNWVVNASNWAFGNKNSTISNEGDVSQTLIDQYANRPLTEEEKKQFKEGFDKGKEMYERLKKKRSFLHPDDGIIPIPVANPPDNLIERFKAKNPKVCGVDRKKTPAHICIENEFILLLASAYHVFPEFLVFEGNRSREAQARNVKNGVSKTMNTRHSWNNPIGTAVDILAKDRKGKWSFQAVDRLGLARGVIYAAMVDLQSKGFLKCWKWENVTLWSFRDAYHIQLNRIKGCGKKVTWVIKTLINFNV